jgi:hypothetical protein
MSFAFRASGNRVVSMRKESIENSLSAAERDALKRLDDELREHLLLSVHAYNLIIAAVAALGDIRLKDLAPSRMVATSILLRLANDLRCAALVVARGYPAQACSLTASIHEAMVTLVAIGSDDAAARKWLNHDDPVRAFGKISKLTGAAMAKLVSEGVPLPHGAEAEAKRLYKNYQQLCQPKHLNPIFERGIGHKFDGRRWSVYCGPDLSEFAVQAAWLALEQGVGLSLWAVTAFLLFHVPPGRPSPRLAKVQRESNRVGAEYFRLNQLALRRWPEAANDPYPGKW